MPPRDAEVVVPYDQMGGKEAKTFCLLYKYLPAANYFLNFELPITDF